MPGRNVIIFVSNIFLASIFLATMVQPALAAPASLQVKIDSGTIEGKASGPVRTFLGIPYAAPPLGELRWKPPAPVAQWAGIRSAKEFGARCMQSRVYSDMVFRDPGVSEDCLSVNVWTAAKNAKSSLPVMVWIHGGGFMAGSSSEPRQDGGMLARRGVVVVSMNYRLGIFGFFVHPELAAESEKKAAGNYGLLDQVAALEWVQRNIASFGGDPANVTIFGESAGSSSVSALMASPLAKGLFHKAIGESGAAFSRSALAFEPMAERARSDSEFANSSFGVQSLKELRALPAQKVLDASYKIESRGKPRFVPDVDGYFLPEQVSAIFAEGKQNDVPLLAGWNRDEGSFTQVPGETPAETLKATAAKDFAGKADEFLRLYPGDNPANDYAQARRSLKDLAGDSFIAWSTWRWLEAQAASGKQPMYRYRFDLGPPPDPNVPDRGAYHSSEIEYVFGALDSKAGIAWRPEDRSLSDLMQAYWTNFAISGNPNGPGLPPWPAYRASSGWEVLYLTAQPKAEKDSARDRYLFLNTVWGK
ncbi:MAG: carboxylesterase/lipase family protein [Terriglobales bacterium]